MAILNVRDLGDMTTHLRKNPHIRQEAGASRELFVEVPRVDALVNTVLFVAIISSEILAARRAGKPAPAFSQASLKQSVKLHLLNFGILGCMKWGDGLTGPDILSIEKEAEGVLYSVIPDLFAGVPAAELPAVPAPVEVEKPAEVETPTGLVAAREEVRTMTKPPATDLEPGDLNNMSRKEMIVELESRGEAVPPNISANAAKQKLLVHLTKVEA